jgi:hypothetical protein
VATREEALSIAKDCPAAEWATIEVREAGPCWAESGPAGVAARQQASRKSKATVE